MYHHLGRPLKHGKGTVAYFSRAPKGKALIFVHGFSGDAVETWDEMNELVQTEEKTAGWDVFFYGYQSMDSQASMSADLLRQFIEVLTDPEARLKQFGPKVDPAIHEAPKYSEVMIVAHSLGAAIARRAIIDALRKDSDWVKHCKLVLFSPAHQGAYLTTLALELCQASRILDAFYVLGKLAFPVLHDLQEDSSFIVQLKNETDDWLSKVDSNDKSPLVASMTIFGRKDRVVVKPGSYCGVRDIDIWDGHGHTSVCKATSKFRDPLAVITSVI